MDRKFDRSPFYRIPAVIAINMIMAGAGGGTLAIAIATWAQVRVKDSYRLIANFTVLR